MDWNLADLSGRLHAKSKSAKYHELQDFECGTFWSELYPDVPRSDYQRLQYSITERTRGKIARGETVSVRAVSRVGEMGVAYIADRLSATLTIKDPGLSGYCLSVIGRGHLVYSAPSKSSHEIDANIGLVYQGRPGTALASDGMHDRLAIWIPQESLMQRASALLGNTGTGVVDFEPSFDWNASRSTALRLLVALLMTELQSPTPEILGCKAASRSFTDLLLYAMLRSLPHSHSKHAEETVKVVLPGTLRRAEAYIRANVEEPIAIHEVAAAAGCGVRSLQLAFRNFRDTTPLLAIRQARLEAAGEAMRTSDTSGLTITEIANRFGFANPGRFTRLYKEAFGETPAEVIGRRKA